MSIEAQLKKSRTITTPLGRKRTFFDRWDSSLLKAAYAYIPQSTVADILNMGLRRLYGMEKELEFQLLLQIHDAVLLEARSELVPGLVPIVKKTLEIPITIHHKTLLIPADVCIGTTWDRMEKAKI